MSTLFILPLLVLASFAQEYGIGTSKPEVAVIAHRGASAYAPENTLAAFRLAIEQGADFLEVDVRQSRDGVPILLHDASVDRTTDGEGKVSQYSLAELKLLDAGSWFDRRFAGERIPTLDELLLLLPESIQIIIEVKGDSSIYSGIERNVVEMVEKSGVAGRVVLKSFDPAVLDRFKRYAPEIPRLYVYAFQVPFLGFVVDRGVTAGSPFDVDAVYLQPHWWLLSRSFVREAHARGFRVIAWGINDEPSMRKAIEYGVDGIETDDPALLRRVIYSKP